MNPIKLHQHTIEIRVRYQETDGQGRLHHANFINYFEVGRVEMLRATGCSYRDLEASGVMLVVVEIGCEYSGAARYDDVLTVETTLAWSKGVRIRHEYRVLRENEVLATGHTIVAAVDPSGKVVRLPEWLRTSRK